MPSSALRAQVSELAWGKLALIAIFVVMRFEFLEGNFHFHHCELDSGPCLGGVDTFATIACQCGPNTQWINYYCRGDLFHGTVTVSIVRNIMLTLCS